MKKEKEVLALFFNKECANREHEKSPFVQGEYVYATDNYILIRIDKSICTGNYPELNFPNCSAVFVDVFFIGKISATELADLLIEEQQDASETRPLGGKVFRTDRLAIVYEAMKLLGVKAVDYRYNRYSDKQAVFFNMSKHITIALMPYVGY
jgi:hypothetical protein